MAEEGKKIFFDEQISRRSFLRKLAKGGAAVVGASLGLAACVPGSQERKQTPQLQTVTKSPTPSPEASPTEEPVQFLTEEELAKAHIRIIQTPKVTLKLEKEIFDFPLFKDAKEGKIKEAVIVLVDNPFLSWAASKKLSEDARLVWQAVTPHPTEHDDKYWKNKLEEAKESVKSWESFVEEEQKRADKIANQDVRDFIDKQIIGDKELLNYFREALNLFNQGRETAIQAEEQWGKGYPEEAIAGQTIRLDTEYDYPQAPRIQKLFQEYPETGKRFAALRRDNPELLGKVFIYVAVGGDFNPRPAQSYPNPKDFVEVPYQNQDTYRFIVAGRTVGENLRHELYHYKTDSSSAGEYEAETKMFNSIDNAWRRKLQGDKSGYPFHFLTAEGETITQKQLLNQAA